jgi:hypothetical protein
MRDGDVLEALRFRRDLIAEVRQRGRIPSLGELRMGLIFGGSPESPTCPKCGAKTGAACDTPTGYHFVRRDELMRHWMQRHPLVVEPTLSGLQAALTAAGVAGRSASVVQLWAEVTDLSWDDDHDAPEPRCASCGIPINVHHGEAGCLDCWDCEACCWDNHAGEPHGATP